MSGDVNETATPVTDEGNIKVTMTFVLPRNTQNGVTVEQLKSELTDEDTRWEIATNLVENEAFKVEVELFDGDAKAFKEEALAEFGGGDDEDDESDDDGDDDEDDDLDDDEDSDDNEA